MSIGSPFSQISDFTPVDKNSYLPVRIPDSSDNNKRLSSDILGVDLCSNLASGLLKSNENNSSVTSTKPLSSSRCITRGPFLNEDFIPPEPNISPDDILDVKEYPDIDAKQPVEKIQENPANPNTKFIELLQVLKQLEERVKKLENNIGGFENFQASILSSFEYYVVNHENVLAFLENHLSTEEYSSVEKNLERLDIGLTSANSIAPFTLNMTKYLIFKHIKQEIEDCAKNFQAAKSILRNQDQNHAIDLQTLEDVQYRINLLRRKLDNNQVEAYLKGQSKLDKIGGTLIAFPIAKWGNIETKIANKVCKTAFSIFRQFFRTKDLIRSIKMIKKFSFDLQPDIVNINCSVPPNFEENLYLKLENFLKSLERCKTLKEVQKILSRIEVAHMPTSFEEWEQLLPTPQYRRHLIQGYYFSLRTRPFEDKRSIHALLKKRKVERDQKINQYLLDLHHHFIQCQQLSFPQIIEYFKKLHIHIDQVTVKDPGALPIPPKTLNEWNACIQNPDFCFSLSSQYVDYQETSGKMTMQMVRQALLSKANIERKFLEFRKVEYFFSIVSSIVQMVLCYPKAKLCLAISALELFVTDFAKLGIPGLSLISIFHPLYPDMSFKIDSIIMILIEHLFAVKYKPNEYSFEGYKLMIQINWISLVAICHYFVALSKQALLGLNIRLIENCVMRLEKRSIENDRRQIRILEKYEKTRLNFKYERQELEKRLHALKVEDSHLIIHPNSENAGENNGKLDPIRQLVESLEGANFDYFSDEVHSFLEEHIGIKLKGTSKKILEETLKDFFAASEENLLQGHEFNQFNYLLKA